jgi:acyl-CoA synthetase (AMP-forming)/AMP-acid ligase II
MTLDTLLGARSPERIAVIDVERGRELRWGEWQAAAAAIAEGLRAAGLGRGDRVLILAARSPALLVGLTACWQVGAVAVPLDPASPPPELAGYASHSLARAALLDPGQEGPEGLALVDLAGKVLRPAARPAELLSADDDALILYTSGSTGPPKGARLTHSGITASLRVLCRAYGFDGDTRLLGTLPLFTSHGLFVHGLSGLVHGGALVLAPQVGAFTARGLFGQVGEFRPTFFSTVPAVIPLLVNLSATDPPPGMKMACASAPLSAAVREASEARFGRPLLNSFGMSEACGWFAYGQAGQPPGSAGRPVGCELRILEGGELAIRGPQVTVGYWRSEVDPFEDGWFRSGDLGRIDEDGWLYCVGRAKRVIHRAGRSIHPEDVEAALGALEGVQEAVVVGVPHEVLGEAPRAFVVARPGSAVTRESLFAGLRERIAAFRLPLWIEMVDRLPRTRNGKPDLRALAELPLP